MAVVALYGFEGGAVGVDNVSLIGTSSYDTGTFRTGARALRCNPASGANGYAILGGTAGTYLHFGLNVATLPSVTRLLVNTISANTINVRLTSTGTLEIYLNTTLIGTSSAAFASSGWHWVGVRQVTGTSVAFLQIDGVDEVTGTATVTAANWTLGARGTEASAVDLFIDDIVCEDTGFLQPSKVDTALPISDNTVTGVTDNNGVTTNIFDCVDNTPPAGVASANEAANPKAGMHFPASTTCDYLANLETYTTLGIGASDTILAVRSIVRHGEDIATGTKNLQNVGALTNPTVGGSSVTAGNDGGAHGAETGLWITQFGTLTTSPSVTLGTSPTIQTSRTSQSRLACVDFMGMLVAWTPGGPSTQTITLGLLDASNALYAPTVTPKNAIGDIGLLDATNALYAPTLAAKNTLTLGLLDAGPTLYAPTLAPQAVTVTLGVLDASNALYAPTLTLSTTVALDLLDSGPALYAPTITTLNTITLGLLDAGNALYAPTVAPQAVTVTLALLDAANALYAPTLVAGPAAITLGLLDSGPALYAPEVQPDQFVSLDLLDSGSALYAPTLAPQAVGISLGLLDSSSALYAPTVAPQSVSVTLGLLDASNATYAPTIAPAAYPITLDLLDSGPALYAPDIIPDQFVSLDLLDSGPALYEPTMAVGGALALTLLDSGSALYAPDIIQDQFVSLDLLDSGPTLYAPTLTVGAVSITLGLLDASPALYAPTVTGTAVGITTPLLDSARALYAPDLTTGAVGVSLPILTSLPTLYAPTLRAKSTLELDVLDSGPALYPPTLLAQQTVAIGLLDSGRDLYDPTLTYTQIAALPILDAARALYAPSVILAAQSWPKGVRLDSVVIPGRLAGNVRTPVRTTAVAVRTYDTEVE